MQGLSSIVASVLHPYLSELQDHPDGIYARFLAATRAVLALGIPAGACCVAAPREAVELLFGGRWGTSAPLLCALGVCVVPRMAVSLTGGVFQSLGDTRDMFLSAVVNTSMTVAAAMLAVGFGVQALFGAGGVLAYSAADLAASPLAPLPALLAKAALCLGAYGALLAATGQWRFLLLVVRSG